MSRGSDYALNQLRSGRNRRPASKAPLHRQMNYHRVQFNCNRNSHNPSYTATNRSEFPGLNNNRRQMASNGGSGRTGDPSATKLPKFLANPLPPIGSGYYSSGAAHRNHLPYFGESSTVNRFDSLAARMARTLGYNSE
ncbi:hypothetical protein PoB_003561000 [Plakobranchus ocellatus]|uniref:Uncharacterized protein n=1 Tax=Plakobranchus ocellatus TaxID=259542 RepID=A0AAV4AQF9_9GAST|nr:hypothetical protein PoB_003561000 [Plakobranchus ocellatus]